MLIRHLVFLIHPFCYGHHAARGMTLKQWPYGPFEDQRVEAWRRETAALPDDAALAMVPLPGLASERTADYYKLARAALGNRFIPMDCPDYLSPSFWAKQDAKLAKGVLEDLRDLCLGQGSAWNKEEMETGLHARACAALLEKELVRRGLRLDRRRLHGRAWGASFEGCVSKYSLSFRRLLRLERPIDIEFDMTMCDAAFLLGARWIETLPIKGGGRLFLFQQKGRGPARFLAIFIAEGSSLGERASRVRLSGDGAGLTVTDKRGIRLWPRPRFKPVCGDVGLAEPEQPLVRLVDGRLEAPLCDGYVYRMAKAPAYFHSPRGMSEETFRAALSDAEIVRG
ncbi:MAG: hypothetical protein NTW19_11490 [Planctomycetota bacterium]|nr:hypothetical protein [Planctomycetota bacterium]